MPVIVSRKTQTLVVPGSLGVDTMFPGVPRLPDGRRLVPHGLRETILLRHMGCDVPNPMDLYYDWCKPAPDKMPYKVQRATCRLMTENARFYNLNHMGTGKTKTALWSWDYLNKQGLAKKMLVVCPLSTTSFVWAREIFSTLPGRKVEVLAGKHFTKRQRLERLSRDADIYIINHDGLKVIESELHSRADINTLVLDELAVYRNDSGRSRKIRKFAARFNIVWGLTGSPMPNEPTDVWSQCMVITPNRVPKYRHHARDALMTRVSNFVWRPKPDAVAKAFSWMQPSCRYSLDDVVELPPVISRTIDVPLSDEQGKTYKKVSTVMVAMVKDKTINAVNAGAALNKLLQIAGGWVYTKNPEYVRLDPTPRIMVLAELVQSANRKVIIAVPYRHMIEGIGKIFGMKGVDIDHCMVHGDTKDRDNVFHLFQSTDKYKALLVDPGCVKHGLTLTAADTVIWYLPIFSLETYDQLNARITRIGQKHKQQILHLQATPVEKGAYKILRNKQKMQNLFLDLVENATENV
jgi:SNF2 family DNA or RNA helicase